MRLTYIPLLQLQHELQGLPRNAARFQEYLSTLTVDGKSLRYPPLALMNPMGKDHITKLLEDYLALDVDAIARQTIHSVSPVLRDMPGDYMVGLVLVDNLLGGWTNRYVCEFNLRFHTAPGNPRPRWLQHDWLTCVLWSSEPATPAAIREALLMSIHRAGYVYRHGPATTLQQMMRQEGQVLHATGCTTPTLESDDLEYTREVLAPFLGVTDKRTCIECLFGDEAARSLGFTPRGLSHWAGMALALHETLTGSP